MISYRDTQGHLQVGLGIAECRLPGMPLAVTVTRRRAAGGLGPEP